MRAFVAVEISEEIREALGRLIAGLHCRNAPVKWVKPENLHITLKFLGSVPDELVPQAVEIVQACAEGIAPFQLEVKGAGGFPNLRRPRVIFVDAQDTPPVAGELARCLNKRMTRVGVQREDRPFQRHITIGRIRKPGPIGGITRKLESQAERSFDIMTVRNIMLMRSELTSQGPIYTPVERVELTATPDDSAKKAKDNQENS